MGTLKRIWSDIRKGENVDLYVTVLAALALAALNVSGLASPTWVAPLTLAVLALLAIAMLGNRHRLESILGKVSQTSSGGLLDHYPDELDNDIDRATDIWIVGVQLTSTIRAHYSRFEAKLKRGGTLKVLLVNPEGQAYAMAMERSYVAVNLEDDRTLARSSLQQFCKLQRLASTHLQIRTIENPLTFGAYMIDPDKANGVIYLKHYPFKTPGGPRPMLVLTPRDGQWYDFFKLEIRTLWENAQPWQFGNA